MERIEEILDTHGKRISEHGRQIDILMERDSEKDKRLALMQKDIESTNEAIKRVEKTTEKIDSKLDKVLDERTDDHLVRPLSDYRKISWQIVMLVLAFIVGLLIKTIFPGL